MTNLTQAKLCLSCATALQGRSDKKFCDDYCRNSYNNRLKSEANNLIRNINNALTKNRRIMEGFIPAGEDYVKIPKSRMEGKGFQFKYFTNTLTNKKGQVYHFCYDYGFLEIENNWLMIVRKNREQKMEPAVKKEIT